MGRRWVSWVLAGLVVTVMGGCADDRSDEPPPMGQAALFLHACQRTEPDHTGPCSDEALATCPPSVSRNVCLTDALDELAAFEAHAANPPDQDSALPLPVGIAVLAATLVGFVVLAKVLARGAIRRNERAFDDELPVLVAMGFAEAPAQRPGVVAAVGTVRRTLLRDGSPRVWLLEIDDPVSAANAQPPSRCAVIELGRPVPEGRLTRPAPASGPADGVVSTFGTSPEEVAFVRTLRESVDPLLPTVTLESGATVVVLRSAHPVKLLGKQPPPVPLAALGSAAVAIADALTTDPR